MNEKEELELEKKILEGTGKIPVMRGLFRFHKENKRRISALELFTDEAVFQLRHLRDGLKVKDHQVRELGERLDLLETSVKNVQDVLTGVMERTIKMDQQFADTLKLTSDAVAELLKIKAMAEEIDEDEIPFQ